MTSRRASAEPRIRASHLSGIALLVLFVLVLPVAAEQLAPSPAYLPVVASFTIACDLLTAALLLVQATMGRKSASAVLACGYAFVAVDWTMTLLAFPGLFVTGTVIGGPNTVPWLGAFRFSSFAMFAMAYLVVAKIVPPGNERLARRFAIAAVPVAFALGLAALALASIPGLPPLVVGSDLRAFLFSGVGPSLFALTFGALVLLTLFPPKGDRLARWLWIAMFSGLVELAFTFVIPSRYSVGWYVGRAVGLAGSLAVLGALCFEVVRLYGALRVSEEQRGAQEREAEELGFLTDIAALLSETLDLDAMLDRVAHRLQPMLGDRVAIVWFDDERVRVGVAAARDAERDLEATLRGSDAAGVLALLGATEALEHRATSVRAGGDPELIVPLGDAEHPGGAILCSRDPARGSFSAEEIRLGEDVAARTSLAIANVRLFERERRLADSLQRELLPASLPQLAGISFDAIHQSGSSEADIGGDWYDAFELPSGGVAFSIGDVAGRGLSAAVVMGRVRQAIRAFALVDSDPRTIAENCDRLLRLDGAPMVSTVIGTVDPATRTIRYVNAGHPGPILVAPLHEASSCRTRTLETPRSLPLGLIENERVELGTFTLAPGEMLVLHTDGLIELERDVERGEAALHAALASFDALDVARPADEIRRRANAVHGVDDIAVLTIAAPPARRATLDVQVAATPENSRSLRHSFRRVAREAGLSEDRTFALEVAIGEAIANVMEHAYGATIGVVRLRAYSAGGELCVEVIDYGRWRAPRVEGRGHGMTLMRELSEGRVDVVRDGRSTSVRFRIDLPENEAIA